MAARRGSEESRVNTYACDAVDVDQDTVKVVRSMARMWPRLSRMQLRVTIVNDVTDRDNGRVFVTDSYVLREFESDSSIAAALQVVSDRGDLGDRFGLRVNLSGKAHPVQSVVSMRGTTPTVESLERLYPTGPTVNLSVSTQADLEESRDGVELTRLWADGEYPVAHPVWVDNVRFGPFGGFAQFNGDPVGFTLHTSGGFKPIVVRGSAAARMSPLMQGQAAGRRLGLIMPMRVPEADPWTVEADGSIRDGGSRAEYYRNLPAGNVVGRR